MEARDILIRPLITERTTQLMAEGKYVFVVAKAANKIEIAKAVAEIFKVKVEKVNTVNVLGKRNAWAARLASALTIKSHREARCWRKHRVLRGIIEKRRYI